MRKNSIRYIIILFIVSNLSFTVVFAGPPSQDHKIPGMLIENSPYYTFIQNGDTSTDTLDYTPPDITGMMGVVVEQIDEDVVLNYIQGLVDFGPRVTESTACDLAGTYIYEEFENMGLSVQYHYWNSSYLSGKNVEATLEGADPTSDKIFIVVGHYDSVSGSPGADDNAAGTVAALAAAEILKDYSFNHTIRFLAVDGEEQGLHGSNEYAEQASHNGDNIIAVLNADMIGFAPNPSDGEKVKVYSNTASGWLYDYIYDIGTTYESHIGFLDIIDSGYSGGSDHVSFWSEGYDAVFYHEYNFNDYYHSSSDTIEHMNLSYDAKVTRLIVATLAELAEPLLDYAELNYDPSYYSAGSMYADETVSTTFDIWNTANGTLIYTFEETCGWLDISPVNGNSSGEYDTITIDIDTNGLTVGEYQCPITINSNGGNAVFTVYLSIIQEGTIDVDQIIFNRGFPIRHAADGDWAAAQSFVPTANTITKGEIYLRKFGNPEFDLTVELRTDNPEGTLLDTTTFTPGEIASSWQWLNFDFIDQSISPGVDYFIVCPPAPSGVTTSFGYEWGYAFGNPYADGSFWFTRDGGALWRDLPTSYEFTFRIYGYN